MHVCAHPRAAAAYFALGVPALANLHNFERAAHTHVHALFSRFIPAPFHSFAPINRFSCPSALSVTHTQTPAMFVKNAEPFLTARCRNKAPPLFYCYFGRCGLLAMAILLKNVFNTPIQRARQLRECGNWVLSAVLAGKLNWESAHRHVCFFIRPWFGFNWICLLAAQQNYLAMKAIEGVSGAIFFCDIVSLFL